jgi:hypothetical protein
VGVSRRRPPTPGRPALELAGTGPLEARVRRILGLGARHRRLAAAVCAGASVLAAVSALTPAPAADPPGALSGSQPRVALPAGAGARPAGPGDRVAVTVRLADPAGVLLLRPGAHVEVVAGAPAGAVDPAATVLAEDAVVVDVPQPTTDDGGTGTLLGGGSGGTEGLAGVVVLSVPRADAHRLAGAAGTRPLTVTVGLPPA